MALSPGSQVGPYEIIAMLGAGGMGEVYRARDPRLRRDVALKALPDGVTTDADRIARFQREAQILASLNHPHIAAIHGLEESEGLRFLVLELIEGQTLASRLAAGPLPLGDALTIGRDVADALQSAHDKGIIHRDIKPANIALTADGRAKVLDFGLAKTLGPPQPAAGSDLLTQTSSGTHIGVVLGTTAYMSPEQARGLPTDKRTDIWAFGCVLYEMATGHRAFEGRTTSDVMAGVLEREPDWSHLPPAVSPRIQWLLQRCLTKDPRQRLQDIGDARVEIDEALRDPTRGAPLTATPARGRGRERIAWAIAGLSALGLVAAGVSGRFRAPAAPSTEARSYSTSIVLPEALRLSSGTPSGRFAISPDGQRLALVGVDAAGRSMLYIRQLDKRIPQPLAGTDGAGFPFWSPDSRFVAFLADGKLKKVALSGGEVETLSDARLGATGAWNSDGVILFTPQGNSPLFRIPASGGAPVAATTLVAASGDVQHSFPFFLPDGKRFLYFVVGSTEGRTVPRGVYVGSLDASGPDKLLVEGASNAKYADGHVLYLRGGVLLAQALDLDRLELKGEPVSLGERVQTTSATASEMTGAFSVSQTGVLAYQTGSRISSQLTWFDRTGKLLSRLGEPADYVDVALSPDNTRVATSILNPTLGTARDVWIFDVERTVGERFTFDDGDDFGPNWSRPDGDRLFYSSLRQGSIHLYEKPARRSGTETLLLQDDLGKFNAHPSSDGQFVAYVAGGGIIARSDIWVLPLGGKKPFALLESPFLESQPQFSPDGRWLAFMSNRSGRIEVYVTPFPGRERDTVISTAGGSLPRWNRNGREIFYLAPNGTLMAATVDGSGTQFQVGATHPLFPIRPRTARLDAYPYDVSSDGRRILVNNFLDELMPPISLIVNWHRPQ